MMRITRIVLSLIFVLAVSGFAAAQDNTLSNIGTLMRMAQSEAQYHELARVQALLAGANALIDDALIETCPDLADAKPLLEQAANARRDNDIYEAIEQVEPIIATCEGAVFAAVAAENGLIAFVSDQDLDGLNELYVMTPNGASTRRLTKSPYEEDNPDWSSIEEPEWSPDGSQIAFTAEESIFLLDMDTLEIRLLRKRSTSPAWSPDGTKILFAGLNGGVRDLFVMSADGKIIDQITNNSVGDYNPVWSPDGSQIAYMSYKDGSGLYITSADGSDTQLLTNEGTGMYESVLDWSPDGSQIVFNGYFNDNSQIAVINTDGTDLRILTDDQFMNEAPSWSPDGTQILFTSYKDGEGEVYIMDADGNNVQALTNNAYIDYSPVWWKAGEEE